MEVARIFKENFRDPDILGRIGGDEFVILAMEGEQSAGPEIFLERLQKEIRRFNDTSDLHYPLSLSMGVSGYDFSHPVSIIELLDRADKIMYQEKQKKKKSAQLDLSFFMAELELEPFESQRIADHRDGAKGHGRRGQDGT